MKTPRKLAASLFVALFSFAALWVIPAPRADAQTAKARDYSKEAFVIERISEKVTFENDGTSSEETTVRMHIQSQAGLELSGLLNFTYPSATSTMTVVYVRVLKPDGRVVQTPAENILEVPADITREAPFYSDQKIKQVAVKGLEVGDTLEYQSLEKVNTPLDPGQFWFSYNFTRQGVVLNEELQVSVPQGRYVKVQSPKLQPVTTDDGAHRILTWETANLQVRGSGKESNSLQTDEPQFPSVQLTSFRSWEEVGAWFRGLAAPRAAPTPEIQAKAIELTRGAKSESEEIRLLYNFVSTKYRYIGVSLGIGRYQPHAAADVLTNDYGDCKDKHTLFAALLAAVGVKSYPALISTEEIDPEVPSPGQFNHVITALPHEKGFLFLDTTPEVGPFGYLAAEIRDKKVLVIPADGQALMTQTPADPPFKSFFTFQADGALDDTGTLTSTMQLTFRGDAELPYRLALRRAGEARWQEVMQKISSNLGFGGTVSDVTATPPDVTDEPFHVQYGYVRKEYSDWANRRISPPFPPVFLPVVSDDTETNSKPIKIGSPQELLYKAAIKLPPNASPQLPAAVDLVESFAEYHAKYTFSQGVLHAERRLVTKVRGIPPGQVAAYGKFEKAIENDVTAFFPVFGEALASADAAGGPEAREFYAQGQQAGQIGNMQGAADAFQRAVDRDPKFALAWVALGASHLALRNADQGIAEVKKGIALDPSQAYGYKVLGSALMFMHRQEEALEIWRALEKANPQDPDAPRTVAGILLGLKRYSEAAVELEAAVQRNSEDARLVMQLGDAYMHSGDQDKAVVTIQKAVNMDHSALILNDASFALADNNLHLDEALRYAEEAVKDIESATAGLSLDHLTLQDLQTMPKLASYWDTLGWAHFRLGHFDLAEKYLTAGWGLTQSGIMADHLGQLYQKQGKTREAAVAYRHALSARPPPEGTAVRYNALLRDAGPESSGGLKDFALQDFRTVHLKTFAPKPAKHASAEFFLLFGPGPQVVDMKFVSGSEELRGAGKTLAAAKIEAQFPDDGPVQILRRGILDCEPEIPGCTFVMYLPNDVHSTD